MLTPSVTPAPAAAPVSTKAITKSLRSALAAEYKDARADLRKVLDTAIKQLYATGAKPTAQQKAAYDAEANGAVDAAALRLSAQASILARVHQPRAGHRKPTAGRPDQSRGRDHAESS